MGAQSGDNHRYKVADYLSMKLAEAA